jgi:hypothetical protein
VDPPNDQELWGKNSEFWASALELDFVNSVVSPRPGHLIADHQASHVKAEGPHSLAMPLNVVQEAINNVKHTINDQNWGDRAACASGGFS